MLGNDFTSSYGLLPAHFHSRIDPTRVSTPRLIKFNEDLASELNLDVTGLEAETLAEIFSGNCILSRSQPIATVYAGHQFGQFVPQLGDGRAILLGEVVDRFGRRREIQLKGSGRTPYSRSGDGRAAVGPVLREYLVSEAMHALGIPATRALAAVATGEFVVREGRLPGAILTRVADSHVRVGTFQFFAARADLAATQRLADYVIERLYPAAADASNPYLALLRSVIDRQASLVAAWMHVGFIHGVMNTDNMTVSGETIDFGPCAFMDAYDPAMVFSSIDHAGRYAYANQPLAAQWNLARFAETLLPLIDRDDAVAIQRATDEVTRFADEFAQHWLSGMRRKLGLFTEEEGDRKLIEALLGIMHESHADFTLTFRQLGDSTNDEPEPLREWTKQWRVRISREPQSALERSASMRLVNPAVIPRNHRIEQAIVAAVVDEDYAPFETLSHVLSKPWEDQPAFREYALAPLSDERVMQTFCGT